MALIHPLIYLLSLVFKPIDHIREESINTDDVYKHGLKKQLIF